MSRPHPAAAAEGPAAPAFSGLAVLLAVEDEAWGDAGLGDLEALVRSAAEAALAGAGVAPDIATELGVTLTGDAEVAALNAEWRGRDGATNVLSFPMAALKPGDAPGPMLGDVVLARGTLLREAADEGKAPGDHLCHLLVHGILHCLGYDHADLEEAAAMERLETDILNGLGVADPYLIPAEAGPTGGRGSAADDALNDRAMIETRADPAGPAPAGGETGPAEDRSSRDAGAADRWGFLSGVFARLKPRGPALVRADIVDALLNGGGDKTFAPEERAMLNAILGLREVRAADVMVPRADIEAIEIAATLGQLMRAFEESGRSRMPVYGETLDDPLGMIHIRDVVGHVTRTAQGAAAPDGPRAGLDLSRIDLGRPIGELDLVRKVLFVPPSMPAANLMARMQATRTQMALVIDEYGGTDGLVSLEDILEMVVGDIEDEHDDEETMIVEGADGSLAVDARAGLGDVRARLGADFDLSARAEDADTVGGLLFFALGRVPARGEIVEPVPGFLFEVLDAGPRRVRRVSIARRPKPDGHLRLVQDAPAP